MRRSRLLLKCTFEKYRSRLDLADCCKPALDTVSPEEVLTQQAGHLLYMNSLEMLESNISDIKACNEDTNACVYCPDS